MKHKYRNYYFPVLICIFFCLCIFLVRHAFFCQDTNKCFSSGYRSQTEFFFFLNTIDSELSELCNGDLNNTAFFPGTGKQNEHPY